MNYYELNLECMKKYRPILFHQLNEYGFKKQLDAIESVEAKDGELAIKVTSESKEYRLNSIYHPKEEAKRWMNQYNFNNHKLVITMFGFGNGIFAKTILENLKEQDKLLIYEPILDIFNHVLQYYDITPILISKNIYIYLEGINEHEFALSLKGNIDVSNYKNQINCHHPQYDAIFVNSYKKYLEAIKESNLYMITNINTGIYFSEKFIENNLKNLIFIKESLSLYELKEKIPNHIPAVVVAAGPSVEQNVEYLKEIKGRAVIFAVDRILDYLLDNGVEPDFIVTVDPKKPTEYFSKRENITIPLICYMESNYDILELHQGKKIFCSKNKFSDECYTINNKPVPFLLPSGSVAIVAFSACVELGFQKIILVGQDLAYDGEKSHGGNTIEINPLQKDIFVEGIDGQMIKSRSDWNSYARRYEDILKVTPNIEVIDAKLKGAKISGTINMELKDIINKYCTNVVTLDTAFLNRSNTFDEEELRLVYSYIIDCSESLLPMREKVAKAVVLCEELIEICSRKKIDNAKIEKYSRKLRNLNKYLEKEPVSSLMDMNVSAITAEELSQIYQFSDNIRNNNISVYKKAKVVYEAIIKTIDYVQPLFKLAVENMKL